MEKKEAFTIRGRSKSTGLLQYLNGTEKDAEHAMHTMRDWETFSKHHRAHYRAEALCQIDEDVPI